MKPGAPLLQSGRLLDQVCERIWNRHYSLMTEKAYLQQMRFFIPWSAVQRGAMRHPRDKVPQKHFKNPSTTEFIAAHAYIHWPGDVFDW